MKKDKLFFIGIIGALILIIISSLMFLYLDNQKYKSSFYPGTYVNGVNIGNMSIDEAEGILTSTLNTRGTFLLKTTEKEWELPMDEIVYFKVAESLENIIYNQRKNNFIKGYFTRRQYQKHPKSFWIDFTLLKNLTHFIDNINEEIEIHPKNAEFKIQDGKKIIIIPHQEGKKIDVNQTIETIYQAISEGKYGANLSFLKVSPEVTTQQLEKLKITDHLFSVETYYGNSNDNRIHNIKLASDKIGKFLLLPGEEFSFNKVVGPANIENGFKEGIIIVDGQFVPGVGGGICQVSSTIYVGALKANLEILQRRNHGRPVSYLPKGLDATISYPYLDLRFRNNTEYGILIDVITTSTHLIVDFYSYKPHFPNVTFQSVEEIIPYETEKIEVTNLKKGEKKIIQKGAVGYRVTTYKIITSNNEVNKELLTVDTYRPVKEIIHIGIKTTDTEEDIEEVDSEENNEKSEDNKKKMMIMK